MQEDPDARRSLSFSQAHGLAPLPSQLQPKVLSKELRAHLWRATYASILACRATVGHGYGSTYVIGGHWFDILLDRYVEVDHGMVDEFNRSFDKTTEFLKRVITTSAYNVVFDLLEYILKHPKAPYEYASDIETTLEECRSSYRLVDRETVVPLASEQEMAAVEAAFNDLDGTEFNGARAHLKRAAEALTRGDFSSSVRESIHAVDGVARSLAPEARDLGPALDALQSRGYIHKAMRDGFVKLYGYTSNEKGIRHALIEDSEAKVTETDAVFMLGSCASFVSYLIGKGREFGLVA